MFDRDRSVSVSLLLVALTAVPNVVASTYVLRVAALSSKFWEISEHPLAVTLTCAATVFSGSAVAIAATSRNRFASGCAVCYLCGLLALLTVDTFSDVPPEWGLSSLAPYIWFFPTRMVAMAMAAWASLLLAAVLSANQHQSAGQRRQEP